MKKIILSALATMSLLSAQELKETNFEQSVNQENKSSMYWDSTTIDNSVYLGINDTDVNLGAQLDLKSINPYVSQASKYYVQLDFIGSAKDGEDKNYLSGAFKLKSPIDIPNVKLSMGIKAVVVDVVNEDTTLNVPLTIGGEYKVNEKTKIQTDLSFAPKVLSFNDSEGYWDLSVSASYSIVKNGDIYVQYKQIVNEYEDGTESKLDNDGKIYVGYKLTF